MKQISTKAHSWFHRISAVALTLEGFRLALAVLLIAAAAFGGFHYIAVAQAQDANGAITGLALSSDSPGELVVSWDMPSPAPSDYRVDWAKSGESYQSYKVDEGHVYPEGSVTTATITDLEAGTEYKVRMRARYNQGEHANSPWSGPWQEASLTVAAEPTPEPTAEPTEEPEDGAIGRPTATGDNAGGLVIAWQAPQAPHDAPTDYRVNWARSDDAYPWYTEEHGNAHPTGATQTLEGLDRDTKYKIRIRARYSPNGQYDAHWSGPWTEITARVVSSPPDTRKNSGAPAAPTLIGTAVTPEGHVTLLWLDPSDDSITGYRVLRGPDADSLAVIEEDTGSTAVSYTDTEAEAGQTHAYAVQARNAAGLSPMSNTRTATVPQNEEEPVAVRQNTVATLVTNLDRPRTGRLTISNVSGGIKTTATSFTTAPGAAGVRYEFSGIRVSAARAHAAVKSPGQFTVHEDEGGQPAAHTLYELTREGTWLVTADLDYRTYDIDADPGIFLDVGATYWIVIQVPMSNFVGSFYVGSTTETAETGPGWAIGDQSLLATTRDPLTWSPGTNGVGQIEVRGNIDQTEYFLSESELVSNFERISGRGLTVNNSTNRAVAITAAAGPWVRYQLSGIRASAARGTRHFAPTPRVTVHDDKGGRPNSDPLYTLENPDGILNMGDTDFRAYTFEAPPGAVLYPGATYWVVFGTDDAQYTIQGTNDTAETGDGWMIGDRVYFTAAGAWVPVTSGTIQFAVLGTRVDLLATETCTVDTSNSGTAVHIPDDRLRAVVEAKLGKSSGATITRGEMAGLPSLLNTHNKSLNPPHAQITNMEGLQYATGLTHLSLQRHRIDNAGLIDFCALTKLTELFLNNNQLTSITIPSLPKLTSLSLSSNRLDSVTILYTPELTYLDLSSNHLSRVIIPPQPKLLALLLRKNRFTSFTIPSLPELIHLDLARQNPRLRSIAIPRLPNLNFLDLDRNQLSRVDVSNLGWMFAILDVRHNSGSLTIVGAKSGLTICDGDTTNSICGDANE